MSREATVYVGPYLRIHNPRKPTTELVTTCLNKECSQHGNRRWTPFEANPAFGQPWSVMKFCPGCGAQIGEVPLPTKAGIAFDFYEETGGDMIQVLEEVEAFADYALVVSNLQGTPGESWRPQRCFFASDNIDLQRLQKDLREFEKRFRKHIEKFERVFGASAVEFRWGVLSDIS